MAPSTGGSDLCVGWRVIVRREFQNWWWPIECEDLSFIYNSIVCVRCIMQQETSSWLHSYLAEVSWWSSSCDHVVWEFYCCFFLWDPLAPKATFVELPPSTNKSNVRYLLNVLFLSILDSVEIPSIDDCCCSWIGDFLLLIKDWEQHAWKELGASLRGWEWCHWCTKLRVD